MRTLPVALPAMMCALLVTGLTPAAPAQEHDYLWQQQQAKVLPTGALEWSPKPFEFQAAGEVRYIDFQSGDDNSPGTQAQPWKHHPWDPQASGNAKAGGDADTFVFKRGSVYRGSLEGGKSGTAETPKRITSDPSWGQGPAFIVGTEQVTEWQQGADNKDIPNGDRVWYADVDFAPRTLYMADGKGGWTRLTLARTPNWEEKPGSYNVRSQWWMLQQPNWWKGGNFTKVGNKKMHMAIDKKNLTENADYYEGGYIWSEWGIMMGAPYASPIHKYIPGQNALAFEGPWATDSQQFMTNNRYYLEDKPHYLDEPGEWWFDKEGKRLSYKPGEGGRIYVRLPGDANPKNAHIEAGKRVNLIDLKNVSNIEISGLHFLMSNVFWNLEFRSFQHPDVEGAAVRILGTGKNIRVLNNRFDHVVSAIRIDHGDATSGTLDQVIVADNEINHTDHGAIEVRGNNKGPEGRLLHTEVLRNKAYDIGQRPLRPNGHFAIVPGYPETAIIAGNIVNWCYAAGIDTKGGKGSGVAGYETPLSRILIFNNQVTDAVLGSNDWGGIETWQGGPFYIFNNVSGNALGPMRWSGKTFSHAYYMDGAFKNYLFNNIAWGRDFSSDPGADSEFLSSVSAFQEIHSYQNAIINNTAYQFEKGSRRQKPEPGRNKFLGNIWQDISSSVFRHSDKEGEDPNVRDAGKQDDEFAYETNAYGNNVFFNIGDVLATFEAEGGDYRSLEDLKKAMQARGAMAVDVGVMADQAPLANAAQHDFRPAPGSAAIDFGVKPFIPWSLYGTVGEWNFTRNNTDPSLVINEAWYMTTYHVARDDYETRPVHPLKGVNITAESYIAGVLEDWAPGALKLNGQDQYLTIAQADLAKPFVFEVKGKKMQAAGKDLKNPQIHDNSFIIETYLMVANGSGGVIVQKNDGKTGYSLVLNEAGQPMFTVSAGGKTAQVTAPTALNDQQWHHLLAEADRKSGKLNLYIDGKPVASEAGIDSSVNLANDADFFVGGTPQGQNLNAALDFLRITLGSLADSKTTIEELYAWQFDGPFLRDFTGAAPTGNGRDAGALELQSGTASLQ